MAADGKGCAREDCHSLCVEYEPGICAFLFAPIIGRREYTVCMCMKTFPIFYSPQGLGSSHSFKQWPFFQF